MRIFKRFASTCLVSIAVLSPLSASFSGFDLHPQLYISGGWRQDHLRSRIATNVSCATDLVKGSDINIWQIGFEGRIEPYFEYCQPCMNNFMLRGLARWGWVSSGIYQHRYKFDDSVDTISNKRGDIASGHTWEYDVGFGYLFPIANCFRIGPSVGYSYDKLTFKADNVIGTESFSISEDTITRQDHTTIIDEFTYFDEGAVFISRWRGPWLGIDASYHYCGLRVNAGYEYHWTHWNGKFNSKFCDLVDGAHYSDKRKGKHGHGHVGFIEADYCYCYWCFGLGLEYKYFYTQAREFPQARGGFLTVGGERRERDRVRTEWHSIAVLLNLGRVF